MPTRLPDHIARPDFAISVRGYERAQVDAYFGRLLEWLADAENRATAAERARESLAREVPELRATVAMLEKRSGLPGPQSMSAFSERMEQVMQSAIEAAQELRAEAERESSEQRAAAAEEADRLVSEARATAARIIGGARDAQREMEESVHRLRAAREETVDGLAQLQRRIAEIVRERAPAAARPEEPGDSAAVGGGRGQLKDTGQTQRLMDTGQTPRPEDTDRTAAVGRIPPSSAAALEALRVPDDIEQSADGAARGGVVTSAPTRVQPAVDQPSGTKRASSDGGRRRSA